MDTGVADVVRRWAGAPERGVILDFYGTLSDDELLRLRRVRYQEAVAERSPVTPDAAALVERLAAMDVPMAVVTGAQRADVRLGPSLLDGV